MKILVIGGTRFFGISMIESLIANGHEITIATRQITTDSFGNKVQRIKIDRHDKTRMKEAFSGEKYDLVIDKIAYCSNDVRTALDTIQCNKYMVMSSTAVYDPLHLDTMEKDFDPTDMQLVWCNRDDFNYSEGKRQMECAVFKMYSHIPAIAVRYPYVVGPNDYTKRLFFYVEHAMKEIPMYIDNLDEKMSFINEDEAGKFMAYLAESDMIGAINGASYGNVSIREILKYVEAKTGKQAIILDDGEIAPYNHMPTYSINLDKAYDKGFEFSHIDNWLPTLLDHLIAEVNK